MASYVFENMSRLGNDPCYTDQYSIQNMASCNYLLQNYNLSDCYMRNPITLATSQPGVNYKGGYGTGAGGCNVDFNNQLTHGTQITHPRSKIMLNQRPFATVPFLGRGYVNPVMESNLMQGMYTDNRKSMVKSSEVCYAPYSTIPLIDSIQDRVTNPSYSVEEVASEDWIRGGVPSRDLTRDRSNKGQ